MSRLRLSSPVLDQVLRLGTLAAVLLIGGLGAAVPAAVAAPTDTVDLGQASSYAVLSGASVGNTVNADGAPHTTLRGDLGVNADVSPTGFPPGVVTGTIRVGATATPSPHRSRRGLHRGRRSHRRYAARRRSRDPDARSRPALHRCRRVEHRNGDPRRRGRPERRLRVQGRRRTHDGGRSPRHAHQRRQGVACVLAGQRRRRRRRERQVRRNADGTPGGRHGCRHGGQRPRAVAQRRDLARLQRVLQRPARGHDHRRCERAHDRHDPDDQRHDRRRGTGRRQRHDRRAAAARGHPLRRRVVGDRADAGERHLYDRRLGHRRSRKSRQRHAGAHGRHRAARDHDRRRPGGDDERRDADDQRHQRRSGRHDRPRGCRLADPVCTRGVGRHLERDPHAPERRHPHRHRSGQRPCRQRELRRSGSDRGHDRTRGVDRRWGDRADQ